MANLISSFYQYYYYYYYWNLSTFCSVFCLKLDYLWNKRKLKYCKTPWLLFNRNQENFNIVVVQNCKKAHLPVMLEKQLRKPSLHETLQGNYELSSFIINHLDFYFWQKKMHIKELVQFTDMSTFYLYLTFVGNKKGVQ